MPERLSSPPCTFYLFVILSLKSNIFTKSILLNPIQNMTSKQRHVAIGPERLITIRLMLIRYCQRSKKLLHCSSHHVFCDTCRLEFNVLPFEVSPTK